MDKPGPMKDETHVLGFPCSFASLPMRDAIQRVLEQIRNRHPKDFERLKVRVLGFRWLPEHVERKGDTVGQWICDQSERSRRMVTIQVRDQARRELERVYGPSSFSSQHLDFAAKCLAQDLHIWPGRIALGRGLQGSPDYEQLAVIAHEHGHAATTAEDFEKRDRVLTIAEWASEACADYYAYRWGFGRQVRRLSRYRPVDHHGGLPGDIVYLGEEGYRVTRRFYYRARGARNHVCSSELQQDEREHRVG